MTEKKRSEQALIQVVQECWLNGVSTRKIENIARRLGIESLSASEVSEINSGLDQMVEEFRTWRLDAEYPVIWADALESIPTFTPLLNKSPKFSRIVGIRN